MRILVTGAAGFVGSHLSEMLAHQGHHVTGLDNYDPYYSLKHKTANTQIIEAASVDFRLIDIRDRNAVQSLVDVIRPQIIVHLAAKAGVRNSVQFPQQYLENNLMGTQNILDSAVASGVERVVLASTSSVYGDSVTIPFQESDPAGDPRQPYAASKRAAELLASTYHHCYGLDATVLRFFTVYGPRGRPDMMPYLLADSLYRGTPVPLYEGDFSRDWTFVTDICDGISRAATTPLGFEILNLGRGNPVSLKEFIRLAESKTGRRANLVPTPAPTSEMTATFADITKAREKLGFDPKTELSDGLDQFLAWFEAELA